MDAIYEGQYSNYLIISSNGQTNPVIMIPVSLTASLDAHINLSLKAFLEGPFNESVMNTGLTGFPLQQPYNTAPWNYNGTETVTDIPAGAVDWVLVELRDADAAASATPSTMIARQATFLMNDGSIRSLDGTSNQLFNNVIIQQKLFAVCLPQESPRHHVGQSGE